MICRMHQLSEENGEASVPGGKDRDIVLREMIAMKVRTALLRLYEV